MAEAVSVVSFSEHGAWSYAPASGGIVNSAASQTVMPSAAGVRGTVRSVQISADPLGLATEVVLRSGGVVLWRYRLGAAGLMGGLSVIFDPPLRGQVGALIEVATTVATLTGGVYVNVQGAQING